MTPGKDYAPCPHCAANNVTYRHVCWRCGFALPYSIGLDGQPHVNLDASAHSVSRAEIEGLLNQAQTFDLEEERRRSEEKAPENLQMPDPALKMRAWFWPKRRRQRESGI